MSDQILAKYRQYLNPNYADFLQRLSLDATVIEARGALIRDHRGREFVDFIAGYGIFNLGHNPQRVIAALRKELDSQPLWNRPFLNALLADLASKLADLAPGDLSQVFICSTGAEAVESAIKLARLATRRSEIIGTEGAFHGFTLGALSVSGIPSQSRPFRPLLPGIRHVPFGDADALSEVISSDTAAVLLEPIQAEIGAISPPDGYLGAAREICDRSGALLIVDEVRTGMGRTGKLFAIDHERIVPDILILGKSLASGIVPIGALVARAELWGRFGLSFAMSASSFAGNRLACAAAVAALGILEEEGVVDRAQLAAVSLSEGLTDIVSRYDDLIDGLTGRGLLIGIHCHSGSIADEVVRRSIREGLLTATAFCNSRCILVEPPLIIGSVELDRGLNAFEKALSGTAAKSILTQF